MKRTIISYILAVGFLTSTLAQTDQRTRETRIADILMQLPASSTAGFNRLMGEMSELDNVVADLAPRLTEPGGNDEQIRLAISGLAIYASRDASLKTPVANSIGSAIPGARSDEIRDFLFIQLQYVAGDESVEIAARYLNNVRLSDAAARVLVRIGSDAAGRALLNALGNATGAQRLTLVQALGDMRYMPANQTIRDLATTNDANLRKTALYSLAQIAAPSSEKILADAAKRARYVYEPTDALSSYVLFLENSLPAQPNMVAKSARRMLKATSENTQIAAKSAALELLTLSLGDKAIKDITGALKSNNKQYRQAALRYSENIKSAKMFDELMKFVVKERRNEAKAEIITAFGIREDRNAWQFVREALTDNNHEIRIAAIRAAVILGNADNNLVSLLVAAMNTTDEQVIAAGKIALLTIAGDRVVNEAAIAIPQASAQASPAFIEILASRRATQHVNVVFSQTSSSDANVRLAAYRALAPLVTENDIPRIVQLLHNASNTNEVTAMQQAMFAAISGKSQDEQTDLVMSHASRSNNPGLFGNVFAMIGGKKALDIVMEYGFRSGNTNMRNAAFEALVGWSDETAVSQLYSIAAGNPSGEYFDRALTAYISKIGAARTPEQRLLMLIDAIDIARTSAQKQNILRQISRTGTFIGLITAGRFLDDDDNNVKQAAVQAARTIALANPQYYGAEITAILNKAMAVNTDPEAEYQRQAIIKHLEEQPKDEGFVSMFNGVDLNGWKGLVENPIRRAAMTPQELAQKQAAADEIMRRDWSVQNGLLVFDGPAYDNLCSEKDYGDFEMYVDWRIAPRGDAGIYLRGSPQVQIWDIANRGASVGSGGLFNNRVHPRDPLVLADNPVNEWNSFYIKMLGEKVTVYLNGQLVADNVTLENYWDRSIPIFETGAIELQAHGDRTEYRNIYVREIPRREPYRVSEEEKTEGFVPMFNGNDMSGWIGNLRDYIPRDGAIVCDPTHGGWGNLYTEKEYSNFIMRFEFLLTPAANNGIGIRTPLEGDAAYVGMELQLLDDDHPVYRNLRDYQYHGSVYGVIAAKRGHLKPIGEWNYQEIIADGNRIKITLNGTVIVDGDLAEASKNFTETIDGLRHPGLTNKSGHIAFLGHGSEVAFRNLRIKELE